MAGVEGGVSLGSMGPSAPALGRGAEGSAVATAVNTSTTTSLASYDVISPASAIVGNSLDNGAVAPTDVISQPTAVAEQARNVSSSALDGAQVAMHSAARDAWAATEPMSVTEPSVRVFSSEVTAVLALTGWQAQNSLVEQPQNLVSTETVSTNMTADEVARAAWDKSEPDSVLTEANKVIEDAVNKSAVHVMSPFEVIGLLSVGAKAQQALSKEASIDHVAPVIEVAAPVELPFTEPLPATSPVELLASSPEVEHAIEMAIQEVSPVIDILPESSDAAVAQKVAELAGELGLDLIAEQALDIATQQEVSVQEYARSLTEENELLDTAVQVAAVPQEDEVQEPLSLVTGEEMLTKGRKKEDVDPAVVAKEQPGPVRDEKAMGRRREIAADVISQMAKDSDALISEEVADAFERRVEEDPNAKSEVVRADGREDGTFGYITNEVRMTSFKTNEEAVRVMDQAISSHPAVAIGPRPNLSEEALNKVLQGKSLRRYASLAA